MERYICQKIQLGRAEERPVHSFYIVKYVCDSGEKVLRGATKTTNQPYTLSASYFTSSNWIVTVKDIHTYTF